MIENPKVSILCWTYNHEKFIKQALDGFLMQKTNFPFEIIVHDDVSTDKTADIIRDYAQRYPDIIHAIYQTKKQWGRVSFCEDIIFPLARGEYVALCEGDDYWTDENKLQLQADYLDSHPDFSICFHPVDVKYEGMEGKDAIYPTPEQRFNKTVLDIKDLFKINFIQTNSVMYRWRFKDVKASDLGSKFILPADWYWHLLHAQIGKIGFIDKNMAVYRRHPNGIFSVDKEENFRKNGIAILNFYSAIEKFIPESKDINIHKTLALQAVYAFQVFNKYNDFKRMQRVLQICPDAFEVAFGA